MAIAGGQDPAPPGATGIAIGQRYVSDAEPELGLGVVVRVDERVVDLAFAAAEDVRTYVAKSAPLRRVRFSIGDSLTDDRGAVHVVESVEKRDNLLYYRTRDGELPESRVAAGTTVSGPRERLASGRVDASLLFDLRRETLSKLHAVRSSPVRGFAGPRIELLPHQFFVAAEVSSRLVPRVLLADETGLGKTIEAGLILSRLVLAGRAQRVLVLVPDSLVHQWLVELRRRFQLRFSVYDEERCTAAEDSEPGSNPFTQEQLVLAGLSLLTGSESRMRQAAEAGWDIVVVDEAHHLEWSREAPGAGYVAVETVSREAGGLLLLTATPEQLGAEGHFARLRLLDPDRYGDYERWKHEAEGFREAARVASALIGDRPVAPEDAAELASALGVSPDDVLRRSEDRASRDRLLAELIDRHGPGRVMFRNTRSAVRGFPRREVHLHPLAGGDDATIAERLRLEIASDLASKEIARDLARIEIARDLARMQLAGDPARHDGSFDLPGESEAPDASPSLFGDPRIQWLASLLAPDGPRKVLVICSSRAKAEAIEAALAARIRVATALFHEGLTLLQRDRGAAWFAEEDGARLMVCSEIGSEGRNFQHAQHLVLFDVPLDPDVVEQRIGRLDRIGQRGTVEIHIPYVAGSGAEALVRWLDEGVGAFRRTSLAGRPLLEMFGARVRDLALDDSPGDPQRFTSRVDALVAETAAAAKELAERVEQGRDRLLEMASLRREIADPLIDAVRELDGDIALEDYFLRLLEHFHVYAEEVAPRAYLLNPDGTRSPEFPSLDHGETVLAFDRETALVREDLEFATRDHPLLGDAMEFLLASPSGNASFALLDDTCTPRMWLEALYVLEPVAPARLHADRFLAPVPVRIVVDQHRKQPESTSEDPAEVDLADGSGIWVAGRQNILAPLVARMMAHAEELAEARAAEIRRDARRAMDARLDEELERLARLAEINDHIRPEETEALRLQKRELEAAIDGARLRPDALRLIWQGPTKDGEPLIATGKR
ncbi:MAG TPA: RNA polymerase-associated protein RapA [Candidatus Limnocylindrales bacterium]|nr:RNA polymerase-associated protein RapA [Candidatus Limnocylindrales bacterium]